MNNYKMEKSCPVKAGEVHDVVIESLGAKGDGIAKIDGFVVIVPGTEKGQSVRVRINAVREKVSFGEVVG